MKKISKMYMKKELFTHYYNLVNITLVKYSNKNTRIYIQKRYVFFYFYIIIKYYISKKIKIYFEYIY